MKDDGMLPRPAASPFDRLTRSPRSAPVGVSGPSLAEADSLETFASETGKPVADLSPAPFSPRRPSSRRSLAIVAGTGLVAVTAMAFPLLQARFQPLIAEESRPGRVRFETRPVGAEVIVDGQSRGYTPLSMQLMPGEHTIAIRSGSEERLVPLEVAAGVDVTQHFEFVERASVDVGKLTVATDPPGARVKIDDEPRGTSPVTVDVTPTHHKVVVSNDVASAERTITTEAGVVSSIVFSLGKPPAVSAGWLAVSAPFEVQVLEQNEIVGTSAAPKFMISAGRHDVDLVNESLGYRDQRRLEIGAGKTTALRLDSKATLSVNARPWAEVTIDGSPFGQTPISNVTVSLGTHQIVFRHPDFGERRRSVVVTAKGPNRVGEDMTK